MAVFFYSDVFKKWLPSYLALLWLINLLHSVWQLYIGLELIGIPGNRNWHASFLLATAPLTAYWLYGTLKRYNLSSGRFLISLFPAVLSFIFLFFCHSRGAWLSFALASLISVLLFLPGLGGFLLKRLFVYGALLAVCLIIFAGKELSDIIFIDVRPAFWHDSLRMIRDNWLFGTGSAGFESAFTSYRGIGYFLRSQYFAVRTIHPHNELLYVAGVFGFVGVAAWSYIWIYPLIIMFRRFNSLETAAKLVLFSFTCLIIHSMFDQILFEWPTIYISCILLGILWGEILPVKDLRTSSSLSQIPFFPSLERSVRSNTFITLKFVPLIILSVYIIDVILKDSFFSFYMRSSWFHLRSENRTPAAISSLEKALSVKNDPVYLYHAGMICLLLLKDDRLALRYFSKLENTPSPEIAHSNSHIGECLLKSGRKWEALNYLRKEAQHFPISIVALHNLLSLENELGLDESARETAGRLSAALKLKGIHIEQIPFILKNPYFDSKFADLHADMQK